MSRILTGGMQRWLSASWPVILVPVLIIKLALAWLLPMTGDEAYFVLWGRHLDYGYYDHPPMAGWMMWVQQLVSEHRVWLRMPGLVTELVIAWALYAFLRGHGEQRARWLAVLFTLSPLSLINVFTLTDTGCILFAALSFLAASRALGRNSLAWAALAGAGLGLAFLSKYFAVLLGIGYLIFYFGVYRRAWAQGLVLVLAAIPFGLVNLHWNLTHCWSNLLFNLVNRNDDAGGIQLASLLAYVAMMLYVVLPPVLLGLRDAGRQPRPEAAMLPVLSLARTLALTGFIGYLLLSLRKDIGLHWVLWFYPMVLVLLWPLGVERLARITRTVSWISVVHVVVLFVVLLLPYQAWQSRPAVQWNLLAMREAPAILALAREEAAAQGADPATLALATRGYTASSVLSYQVKTPVMVLGTGSRYARQDDAWTDLRAVDGRDVLVLIKRTREAAEVAGWFASASSFTVSLEGQEFHFVLGRGFRYAHYHETVLPEIRANYYTFPDWLPECECEFIERYFPQQ